MLLKWNRTPSYCWIVKQRFQYCTKIGIFFFGSLFPFSQSINCQACKQHAVFPCFYRNKRSGLWHAVIGVSEKNGSDCSLTAVPGFRNSICHWVLVWQFTSPKEKKSQINRRRSDSLFISVKSLAARSAFCEWTNKRLKSGQQHPSRSILHHNISIRRQTMWEPMCLRMQMLLFHTRGDGLCNGEQNQHAEMTGMRQTSHHKPVILPQMLKISNVITI